MYTHVIFDLDGTLLNTIDDLTDAGNYVCAAHGWPTHTVEQFKRMVGNGIPTLVSRLAPEGTDEGELAAALAEFSAWYDAHKAGQDQAPYGGVPQVVDALKAAGVTVAVLSNKAHALAESVVEGYYPGVFDAVQGALPDVPVKPDPTLLNKLMEQLGADRAHTLFVGDSNVDIQTGKNGGLATCGVLWGFRSRRELELAGRTTSWSIPSDGPLCHWDGASVPDKQSGPPSCCGRGSWWPCPRRRCTVWLRTPLRPGRSTPTMRRRAGRTPSH